MAACLFLYTEMCVKGGLVEHIDKARLLGGMCARYFPQIQNDEGPYQEKKNNNIVS